MPTVYLLSYSQGEMQKNTPHARHAYLQARHAIPHNAKRLPEIDCSWWLIPPAGICAMYSGINESVQSHVLQVRITPCCQTLNHIISTYSRILMVTLVFRILMRETPSTVRSIRLWMSLGRDIGQCLSKPFVSRVRTGVLPWQNCWVSICEALGLGLWWYMHIG